jgi:hypothetical protein
MPSQVVDRLHELGMPFFIPPPQGAVGLWGHHYSLLKVGWEGWSRSEVYFTFRLELPVLETGLCLGLCLCLLLFCPCLLILAASRLLFLWQALSTAARRRNRREEDKDK